MQSVRTMEANYTKITRPDPDSENTEYTDHTLDRNTTYCCEQFKVHCKKFPSWSYEKGRFTIIDSITYDGNTQIPIDYCPFCGEKIAYRQIKR